MPSESDRIDALERRAGYQEQLIDGLLDALLKCQARAPALQSLLVEKGVLRAEEVAETIARMEDSAEWEVEFGPQHEEFRRVRRLIQEDLDDEERGGEAS